MSIATRLPAQERRAAILDAAIRLFAEKGFRGTTTRELAAAVGVTEPVLYQHFPSKRDLYNAIIEFKMEQQDARDPALLADFETSTDDEHLLRRLADAILLSFEQDAEFVRLLLYSALEGHELADLVHERRVERHLNVLARYLGRRMKDGVYRQADPLVIAHTFTGMVVHQGLSRLLFCARAMNIERRLLVESIVDLFLRGIRNSREDS